VAGGRRAELVPDWKSKQTRAAQLGSAREGRGAASGGGRVVQLAGGRGGEEGEELAVKQCALAPATMDSATSLPLPPPLTPN